MTDFSFTQEHIEVLIRGGVGVIPTDTLYGIVGRAEMPDTVARVYHIRKRSAHKPCIVLISDYVDLEKFGVVVSPSAHSLIEKKKLWPGKVSIVFPVAEGNFEYLTRGTGSIAFRMPETSALHSLLIETGPLIAPSANHEGEPPATTVEKAFEYFSNSVDFYVDAGMRISEPSTLITVSDTGITILREGAVTIE